MEKTEIIEKFKKRLGSQKARNYTYIVAFFVVFSIFIVFAIRPSLKTAFELRREQKELSVKNNQYEEIVRQIIQIQSTLEKNRDRVQLLSEAVSEKPNVNKLINDIEKSSASSAIGLSRVNIGKVDLVTVQNQSIKPLKIDVKTESSFENLLTFIDDIFNQRRLKSLKKINALKGEELATESGKLEITIELEGYYL